MGCGGSQQRGSEEAKAQEAYTERSESDQAWPPLRLFAGVHVEGDDKCRITIMVKADLRVRSDALVAYEAEENKPAEGDKAAETSVQSEDFSGPMKFGKSGSSFIVCDRQERPSPIGPSDVLGENGQSSQIQLRVPLRQSDSKRLSKTVMVSPCTDSQTADYDRVIQCAQEVADAMVEKDWTKRSVAKKEQDQKKQDFCVSFKNELYDGHVMTPFP